MFNVRSFDPKTIRWWYGRRFDIDMEPPYQRKGKLWSISDKQLLIDSVLNEYDVPKLYIADFTLKESVLNKSGLKYAIIDGKQRIESIFDFLDGTLVLAEDFIWYKDPAAKLGGLGYRDLLMLYPEAAQTFDDYIPSVVAIVWRSCAATGSNSSRCSWPAAGSAQSRCRSIPPRWGRRSPTSWPTAARG
ncbi:MAG: DUF262 domain-containing protein [Comamonadaceae bacterium]|nr:MAG: DUF262 domain-containing protein [Comamonadaceae bacterium]